MDKLGYVTPVVVASSEPTISLTVPKQAAVPKVPKSKKGKLAKSQGNFHAGISQNKQFTKKSELSEYEKDKVKIKHFYKMMDDAYYLVQKYEKLLNEEEKKKKVKENPALKGVTFTL